MPALHRRIQLRFTGALLAAAALTGACSDQGVTGPAAASKPSLSAATAPAVWTGSGPGNPTTSVQAGSTSLSYDLNPAGFSTQTWELTSTAQGATATVPYTYAGNHAFFQVTVSVQAIVNGEVVETLVNAGPTNCCSTPSNGFEYGGSYTFMNLQPGDTYGFRFGGRNFDFNNYLRGTFTVTTPSQETCKNGGWMQLGFANQGLCVSFVQTGKDSR
jgi:hypothetical protein